MSELPDDQVIAICLIAVPIFLALIGMAIGHTRGRAAFGFFMGLLLGPIGWLIILCLSPQGEKCSQCLGVVPDGAIRCQHCGQPLYPLPGNAPQNNPFRR